MVDVVMNAIDDVYFRIVWRFWWCPAVIFRVKVTSHSSRNRVRVI